MKHSRFHKIASASILWIALCTSTVATAGVVVWDNARRGLDQMESVEPMGTAAFHSLLVKESEVKRGTPESGGLKDADAYVLYAPVLPVSEQDGARIESYVRGGGRMLLVAFKPERIASIMKAAGLRGSQHPLRDETNPVRDHGASFYATAITPSPLTEGEGKIAVTNAHALTGSDESSTVLVATGPHAYVDTNENGVHDDPGPRSSYPIVTLVKHGKGEILLIGDDAVLSNQNLLSGNNRAFAQNVARWLAGTLASKGGTSP